GESVRALAGRATAHPAGISAPRSGQGRCLRPYTPRPCRRLRAFRRCGSGRRFGRSLIKKRNLAFESFYLNDAVSTSQRTATLAGACRTQTANVMKEEAQRRRGKLLVVGTRKQSALTVCRQT